MHNQLPNLGTLEQVDLRKVWNHEAHDYTQWLAKKENLEALSDAIGLEITLIETEASVGRYNVDILAQEENTGRKIVIENQLESTNHDHLGKIITYASGHDAEIIIWIVKEVGDEHKQALDWLNEHTDDQTYFFLVKMEVWKIGDSQMAPKFNVVSQPNSWAKTVRLTAGERELTETKLLQLEYWTKLKEFGSKNQKIRLGHKPAPQHWFDISIGRSDCHIALTLNKFKGQIYCLLYINDDKKLFEEFFAKKDQIEKKLGYTLEWFLLEDKKASIIQIAKNANYSDENDWENQFEWLLERASEFSKVFGRKAVS